MEMAMEMAQRMWLLQHIVENHVAIVKNRAHFARRGDQLSRCVSDVLRLIAAEVDAHMEIDAYHAPSECHNAICRGFERRLQDCLARHGYTGPRSVDAFMRQVKARVSSRWVHFNLGHVLGVMQE